ncbi:unnamed protein product [Phyllotreta striolata]|uniref:Glucosamine-6-phosphate deaminase n=1 Tax=Phyllotreta striolata TaxID=444603 RepID=A0A9N9TCG6_PHYSR|nr:unnamed protein product [Phyllotreta striolata]
MMLIIRDTKENACKWISSYMVKKINEFKPNQNKYYIIGFCLGESTINVLHSLVDAFFRDSISFRYIKLFVLEEYVNLPENHPRSNHYLMWRHLFRHVDIQPANVFIPNGNVKDLITECHDFEENITKSGGLNMVIGEATSDGQLSYNEPASSLGSRTRVKSLAQGKIDEKAKYFDGVENVPRTAISAGIKTIMDAQIVIICATGFDRSMAIYKAMEEGINHMVVLSAFQKHPKTVLVCDKAATIDLKARTIEYFNSLEDLIESKEGH